MSQAADSQSSTYEKNLEKLRAVVGGLEKGTLGLEESLKLFEEGIALSGVCDRQLSIVEERVKVLVDSRTDLSTRGELPVEQVSVNDSPGES